MSADGAAVLPKSHSEDAFLLQKKRIPLEAQRISDIVERCISQVEIAASMPGIISFCEESGVVDRELNKALQAHEMLGERVEKLEGLTSESDEKPKEEDEERRRRKRVQLGKDIKNSVRDVLRVFKSNPDAFFDLRVKLVLEVGESERTLIKALKMFRSHMLEMFLPSQERKLSNQPSSAPNKGLAHLILKEEEVTAVLKQLDEKIPEMESRIKSLQSYLKEDYSNEIEGPRVLHKQDQPSERPNKKLISLQQEIDQLTIQLNNLRLENGQAERTLREKNEMLEMETENLLVKFDEKMKDTQAKLEVNQSAYEKEQGELKELEKPFSVLEVEFNQIQEKRRLAEEKRMQEMRDLELKTKAAIIIQAWWKGYITRKALKNKSKSKKTKKGKGKKSR